MKPKATMIGNEKVYNYGDWLSRLRLPDYCPKCKSRDVYVSHNENGKDILRCWQCGYSVISPTIKEA